MYTSVLHVFLGKQKLLRCTGCNHSDAPASSLVTGRKLQTVLSGIKTAYRLGLRNGWDTDSWGAAALGAEQTASEDRDDGESRGSQEDEEREVKESNGGLGLSASAGRTLSHSVALDVGVVGARVDSDGSSDGGGSGEGEDQVQEVEDGQDAGPGEGVKQESQHTVEGGEQDAEGSGENTEVHSWVGVGIRGGGKRCGQAESDDQEHEVHGS